MMLLLLFGVHSVSSQMNLFILLVRLSHINHVLAHFVGVVLIGLLEIGIVPVSRLVGLHHGELVVLLNHAGQSFIA